MYVQKTRTLGQLEIRIIRLILPLTSHLAHDSSLLYNSTMTLNAYLEHLRGKPHHVRKQIAFWSSLGITAIILAFWLASFSSSFGEPKPVASNISASTPGQSMMAAVGSVFTDIKDFIFTPKKVTYTVEVSPGK